ncbi:MAG: HEPN domain-containing protein [Nitrososphaera sp.]
MTEQVRKLLEKADRAIRAADALLKRGDPDFAAGRAYYAMFYAAEALLIEKGLRFRKHGSVHAAFGEHFAKGDVLDAKYHRWLLNAYDQRILGDYGVEASLTPEDVKVMIQQAQEFVGRARSYMQSKS